jgi:uncharacterized protein (DUF1684 family)
MGSLLIPVVFLLLLAVHTAPSYRADIEKFRADRAAELRADDGWLTVAGLFWLKPGVNTAGSANGSDVLLPAKAPARLGTFELKDGAVTFTADPSARVTSGGKPIATVAFDLPAGDRGAVVSGDLVMFPIQRGDRIGIRMRDLHSAMRQGFTGVRSYPVRPEYRITAKFTAYPEPRKVLVPNVLGQQPEMTSPGYVRFTVHGRTLRLEPVFETGEQKELFFIFSDATSRDATYRAGRFLYTPLPKDGVVILDFNKAINPPCAFTEFATCPLPLKENRLPVRIEAGELAYHGPTR